MLVCGPAKNIAASAVSAIAAAMVRKNRRAHKRKHREKYHYSYVAVGAHYAGNLPGETAANLGHHYKYTIGSRT